MTAPRTPQDRLPKKPRRVSIRICVDTEAQDAYAAAANALAEAERDLAASLPVRLAKARASAEASDESATTAQARVAEDDAAALAPLRAARDEAKTVLDSNTATITFRSIGRRAWDDLIRRNPPTQEEKDRAESTPGGQPLAWSDETMPGALLEAALVECTMDGRAYSLEGVYDDPDWSVGDLQALYAASVEAQLGSGQVA